MRYLIILLLFLSCQEPTKPALENSVTDSELTSFLNKFRKIELKELRKIDFNRVQNDAIIDFTNVLKFLCFERNSCVYSKSSIMNSYFTLFRYNLSDTVELIFYRVNEAPVYGKTFVAALNKHENRINSKLIVSNFNPVQDIVSYNLEIRNNLEFKLTRTFTINNYYIEPSESGEVINPPKKIIETYVCDKNGYFNLRN